MLITHQAALVLNGAAAVDESSTQLLTADMAGCQMLCHVCRMAAVLAAAWSSLTQAALPIPLCLGSDTLHTQNPSHRLQHIEATLSRACFPCLSCWKDPFQDFIAVSSDLASCSPAVDDKVRHPVDAWVLAQLLLHHLLTLACRVVQHSGCL